MFNLNMKINTFKKFNSITNGLRQKINLIKSTLAKKKKIIKDSTIKIKRSYGRSKQTGEITSWHKCRGNKKLARILKEENNLYKAVVIYTAYDPFRSNFVTLNFDILKKKFFQTPSIKSIFPGTILQSTTKNKRYRLGDKNLIKNIPAGTIINNLGKSNKKAQFIKSAGTQGQIIQSRYNFAKVKLPSNQIITVSTKAFAVIGILNNSSHNRIKLGKAGLNRHLGRRPVVRGIAMNPVDHPHGGRTNGGIPSVTPWGLPTKGGFYLKKK